MRYFKLNFWFKYKNDEAHKLTCLKILMLEYDIHIQ